MPEAGELVFAAPRRAKPPRHLADLTPAERRDVVAELGEKPFRAGQLSTHYFSHLADDPQQMTDVPQASRERLAEALLPPLLTPVKHLEADKGATRKTVWRLFDGATVESVLMRYPRPDHGVRLVAGRLRHELPVLRDRPGRPDPQHVGRRDRRPGGRRRAMDAARRGARRSRPGVQRRLHGHGRAAGQLQRGALRRTSAHRPDPGRARPLAAQRHRLDGRPRPCDEPAHRRGAQRHPRAVPARPRRRAARRAGPGQHPLEGRRGPRRRAGATSRRPAGGCSIEYALIRDINDHAWRADLLGTELNRRGRGWVHVNPIPLNPTPGSKWTASDPGVERRSSSAFARTASPPPSATPGVARSTGRAASWRQ